MGSGREVGQRRKSRTINSDEGSADVEGNIADRRILERLQLEREVLDDLQALRDPWRCLWLQTLGERLSRNISILDTFVIIVERLLQRTVPRSMGNRRTAYCVHRVDA